MAKAALASAVMLGLAGCQSGQSAGEVICFAAERAPGANDADPSMRAMKIAQYVEEHLKHRKAIILWSALGTVAPADKGKLLRAGLAEIGYRGTSPTADLWDQTAPKPAAAGAAPADAADAGR